MEEGQIIFGAMKILLIVRSVSFGEKMFLFEIVYGMDETHKINVMDMQMLWSMCEENRLDRWWNEEV